MAEATLNDVFQRLECMKLIINGVQSTDTEKKTKGKVKDDPPCLIDAKGLVNTQAKALLLEHVEKTIESLNELCGKQKHQQGEKWSKWFLKSVLSPGQKRVQVFLPKGVRTPNSFKPALVNYFKEFSIKADIVEDITNLNETLPLFVVCPSGTRIESDIDEKINGLNWKSNYSILIIHFALESALPLIPTSKSLHGNEKYSNIKFIDVAYLEEKGCYPTEMNANARKLIQEFAAKGEINQEQ